MKCARVQVLDLTQVLVDCLRCYVMFVLIVADYISKDAFEG